MRVYVPLLALVVFAVSPLQAQHSKDALQQMYVNYLRGEGYSPMIDDDGDIYFKREGRTFYIIVHEDDPEYFQIYYGINLTTEDQRRRAAEAANYANSRTKVARVYIARDGRSATITAEVFLKTPDEFRHFFTRMVSSINTARGHFVDQLSGSVG